jgi:GNAT superfamily N-acetyltransferase
MRPVIRRLRAEQWQTYRDVRLMALRDAPEAFGASYEDALRFAESDWIEGFALPSWFAFIGDAPVGVVRMARSEEEVPRLISMWVAPPERGSSAAGQLVESALQWARDAGKAGVALNVVADNARAQALYRRCGFAPTGVTGILPDGRSEIEMAQWF